MKKNIPTEDKIKEKKERKKTKGKKSLITNLFQLILLVEEKEKDKKQDFNYVRKYETLLAEKK